MRDIRSGDQGRRGGHRLHRRRPRRGAAPARRRGHRHRRLEPRAGGREGAHGRPAGAVPELRGDARRPGGRGRPPHHAQPPALRAGARRARGRQARRVREAAGHELGRDGRAAARSPRTAGSSTRSTSTSASTPRTRRRGRAWRRGEIGDVRLISGGYLQDWLLFDTDWNWRLDPAAGGSLRAVGDIGSHWIDLVTFITGRHVEAVMADLTTFIGVRKQPTGPVETFSGASAGETVDTRDGDRGRGRHPAAAHRRSAGGGDDLAGLGGPQEPAELGDRRLRVRARLALRGARGAVDRPPRAARTSCCCASRRLPARPRRGLPGHLQAPLPRRLRGGGGRRSARRAGLPDLRRRPRGGADRRRRRALARRAALGERSTRWRCDEARPADRRLPDADARRDRRLGGRQRLRDARGGLLAGGRGRRAPLRGRLPHRRRPPRRGRRRPPRAARPGDLGARLLPEPAVGRRRGARRRARAPAQGDRRGGEARRRDRRHLRGPRPHEEPARLAGRLPRGVAAAGGARRRATACGSRSRTAR